MICETVDTDYLSTYTAFSASILSMWNEFWVFTTKTRFQNDLKPPKNEKIHRTLFFKNRCIAAKNVNIKFLLKEKIADVLINTVREKTFFFLAICNAQNFINYSFFYKENRMLKQHNIKFVWYNKIKLWRPASAKKHPLSDLKKTASSIR